MVSGGGSRSTLTPSYLRSPPSSPSTAPPASPDSAHSTALPASRPAPQPHNVPLPPLPLSRPLPARTTAQSPDPQGPVDLCPPGSVSPLVRLLYVRRRQAGRRRRPWQEADSQPFEYVPFPFLSALSLSSDTFSTLPPQELTSLPISFWRLTAPDVNMPVDEFYRPGERYPTLDERRELLKAAALERDRKLAELK